MTRLVILNFPPPRNRSINLPANRHCWCTRSFSSGGTIRLCYLNSATGGKGPKHAWLPAKKIGLNRSSANLKWADLVTNFLLRSRPDEGSREEKNSKLAIMVDTPRFNHHSRPITTRFKIRASISSRSVVARTDHQFSRARECQIELHRWTINRARGRVIRYTFRRGRDSQVGKKLWGGEGGRNGNGRRIRRKNGARNTAYVGVRTKYSGVGGEGCSSSSINTHYRQPLRVPRRPSSISFTPDTISLPHFEPPLLLSSVRMLERPVSFSCTRLIAFPRATKNTDRPTREFRRIRVRSQVSGLLPFAANSLLLVSRPLFFVTRQREGERFYLFYSNRPGLGFGLDETLASVFEIVWIVAFHELKECRNIGRG